MTLVAARPMADSRDIQRVSLTFLVIRPVTVCILGVINRCTVIGSRYPEVV